jgi:hypothetical protein
MNSFLSKRLNKMPLSTLKRSGADLVYEYFSFRIGAFYTTAKINRNSAQALTVKSEY